MNQTTTPKKKEKDNTLLYAGALLLLGFGAYAYNNSNKNASTSTGEDNVPNPNIDPIKIPTAPIAIYVTKILKMGSQGLEVTKLQGLMKITADGFFGPQTEAMLLRLKGVKEISLDQYAKLPTINRNVLANGTKVMVSNKNGAKVYGSIKKADRTYYSSGKVEKTIAYGQAVGTIRSQSTDGNSYTVFYNDLWNGDFFTGTAIGFVNAVDIQKYL